LIRRG